MSREHLNARAFRAAQWAWDNMAPPSGGPCECAECNGSGQVESDSDVDGELIDCMYCDGTGKVDENGEPWIEGEEDET
jgi:DnaJ-class molecular chaperone